MRLIKQIASSFFHRNFLLLNLCLFFLACGQSEEEKLIDQINTLLEEREYSEARSALQSAIRETPKSPVLRRQQVLLYLQLDDLSYAINAYRALSDIEKGNPVLHEALKHKESVVRANAAKALGFFKDPESIPHLIEASKDLDNSVQQEVIVALGDLRAAPAVPVLINFIQTPQENDWFIRGEAAMALGKIGDVQAVNPLFLLLKDPDSYVKDNARKALLELITEDTKPAYLAALKSKDPKTQTMAALALAQINNSSGLDILIQQIESQMESDEPKDAPLLIGALVKLRDPQALPSIRKTLSHPHPTVKTIGILALGELKDKASVSRLKKLSKSKSEPNQIKTACHMALRKIAE